MSCSVIIKDVDGECERRVCVDSEEELKNMTVEELRRRVCPEDEHIHYELVYENTRHQTGAVIHEEREQCVIYPQGPKEINDFPLPRAMSMEKLVPMRKIEITYVTVREPEEPQSH